MTAFQWIGVAVATMLAGLGLGLQWRHRGRGPLTWLWIAAWIAAGVAIARPEIIAVIARTLGIGRGADLVLYCWVIASLLGGFALYARQRQLNRQITQLVRHLALEEARLRWVESPSPDEETPRGPAR